MVTVFNNLAVGAAVFFGCLLLGNFTGCGKLPEVPPASAVAARPVTVTTAPRNHTQEQLAAMTAATQQLAAAVARLESRDALSAADVREMLAARDARLAEQLAAQTELLRGEIAVAAVLPEPAPEALAEESALALLPEVTEPNVSAPLPVPGTPVSPDVPSITTYDYANNCGPFNGRVRRGARAVVRVVARRIPLVRRLVR